MARAWDENGGNGQAFSKSTERPSLDCLLQFLELRVQQKGGDILESRSLGRDPEGVARAAICHCGQLTICHCGQWAPEGGSGGGASGRASDPPP